MAWYSLMDGDSGRVVNVRRMDHDVARLLNNDLQDGSRWVAGLDPKRHDHFRTLEPLLRSLDLEGFDGYSINVVESWLDQQLKSRAAARDQYHDTRRKFSAFMHNQPRAMRKLVGDFIRMQCGHNFEAGLRLGLTGQLAKNIIDKEYEDNGTESEGTG